MFQCLSVVDWRFQPPAAHAERDLPLPKTPEGAIAAPQPSGIRGMSLNMMSEKQDPGAVAVTDICVNGRTMKPATETTLTVGGQLHGQLHASIGFLRSPSNDTQTGGCLLR